ncbi:hypothetical protein MRX96_027344 [Rhipicephalus microplus]
MLITSSGDKRRPNNVSDVRPSSRHLREYTAYLVGSRCSLCLLVYYFFSNLQRYCYPRSSSGAPRHVRLVQRDQRLLRFRAALHVTRVRARLSSSWSSDGAVCLKLMVLMCRNGQKIFIPSNMKRKHSLRKVFWLHRGLVQVYNCPGTSST